MKTLIDLWGRQPVPQKIAYLFGYSVMLTGLAHLLGYFLAADPQWAGPIGFRKTIVFGLSAGFTLVTMGWLLRFYKPRPRLYTIMMSAMSAALVIEIIIIDGQRFRGLPSHFNMGSPLDAALWSTMGLSILVFAIVSTIQGILAFGRLKASPVMRIAIRASMLIFVYSQLSGQFIVSHGMAEVFQDGVFALEKVETATTVGQAGDLKLPHAISLHSIQALPLIALLLAGSPIGLAVQRRLVVLASLGLALIVAMAQYQAFAGRAIADGGDLQSGLLLASVLLFMTPFAIAVSAQACKRLDFGATAKKETPCRDQS